MLSLVWLALRRTRSENAHQPARGIETMFAAAHSFAFASENAHQPARGIETCRRPILGVVAGVVRTPINPPEGLKQSKSRLRPDALTRENAHQPARGIETIVLSFRQWLLTSENAHQPARGIETGWLFAGCLLHMVRTPINPPEGLKQFHPLSSFRQEHRENAHQPARGIETTLLLEPNHTLALCENAHQPARGIETFDDGRLECLIFGENAHQPARGIETFLAIRTAARRQT